MKEHNEKINVFMVDDHDFIIEGMASLIELETDIQLIGTASDGKDALNQLLAMTQKPDVLITDYSMPNMDGLELTAAVKEAMPSIKILVLSMHDTIGHVRKMIDAEAEGYILKSSDKMDLVAGIRALAAGDTFYSQKLIPLIIKSDNTAQAPSTPLSAREQEVLKLLLEEKTSKEIADALFISKRTVDSHRIGILEKTNCKSILGLYKYALSINLLQSYQ